MSCFSWTENLGVYVDQFNDQHKVLIGVMDEIYNLNQQKVHRNQIEQSMDKLVAFAGKHFAHEEQYLQSVGYEEANSHKILHRELLLDLLNEVEGYRFISGDEVFGKCFSFLHRWVVVHTKGSDGRFSDNRCAR